jgi:spore maturation protein CgeB
LSYRILCIGETWLGSDARGAFLGFRRLGHSVMIVDEWNYVPMAWRSTPARVVRKSLRNLFVKEMTNDCMRLIRRFKPHLVFIFKGNWVHPDVVKFCRSEGIPVVNYYPDVSFMVHGKLIPETLPHYDHIFTTKTYGIRDMKETLGITNSSFLEPGFDPDVHRPLPLSDADQKAFGCDLVFIGTWSPKKEEIMTAIYDAHPKLNVKIWGCQWEKGTTERIRPWIQGDEVTGDEYTKALCGAKICLGLLSERRTGASSGDLITARTFQIPACGSFMLHERNPEVLRYFDENRDAGFFEGNEEMLRQIGHFLQNEEQRRAIAQSGMERSHRDGYSIDAKMQAVIRWFEERKASR